MRGWTGVMAVALAAGCAAPSGRSEGVAPPSSTTDAGGSLESGGQVYVSPEMRDEAIEFDAPLDVVWNATIDAYRSLGIETVILESEGLVGNPRVTVRRRLAGDRLSRYVRCGSDASGMPAADSYRVRLDVRSRVTPAPEGLGARVRTTVEATARDVTGVSTEPVQCATTGALEARIAGLVAEQVDEGG